MQIPKNTEQKLCTKSSRRVCDTEIFPCITPAPPSVWAMKYYQDHSFKLDSIHWQLVIGAVAVGAEDGKHSSVGREGGGWLEPPFREPSQISICRKSPLPTTRQAVPMSVCTNCVPQTILSFI